MDTIRFFSNDDADLLLTRWRIADAVVDNGQVAGFSQDADAASVGSGSVVQYFVLLEVVPMARHRFGFVAEEDALVSVSDGAVIGKGVVRVFVADGDTGLTVVQESVVFKTPVPDPPAQE